MTATPHSGPETSRAAAEAIEPHAGTLEALVLAAITFRGTTGATDEELQTALRMDANTQRPRRWSLAKKGLIEPSGKERLTRAGRRAQVWVRKP